MLCKAKWNENGWICTTQMNSFRFPQEMTHCWFSNCQGRAPRPVQISNPKPNLKPKQKVKPEPKPKTFFVPTSSSSLACSYVNCNKPRMPNRKYCSDDCRKKQARWNYRNKNK